MDNDAKDESRTDRDGLLIYHIFADTGVESEPLSAYGRVERFGLDPRDSPFTSKTHAVDLSIDDPPVDEVADLALLHPPCQKWSTVTKPHGTEDNHPDLIPRAREIASEHAEDYIIENVPGAPLNDPVLLEGRMFGLPITYKRAFETSFYVEKPSMYGNLLADGGDFAEHQATGGWQGSTEKWRSVKQVTGDYPSKDLKRSGIPAPYIHYLMRWYHE